MMKRTQNILCSISLWIVVLVAGKVSLAQQGLNINFLSSVPQSGYINPGVISPHRFYIGFPLLSSMKVGAENTAFHYDDIIKTRQDDSLYVDLDDLYDKLDKKNYFRTEFTSEVLAFGFKVKNASISLNLSEKFYGDFMYPKEFISLLLYGNSQFIGTTVNVGGLDLQATQYHELALGLALPLWGKLSGGFRAKYLAGIANVSTKSMDMLLYSPDDFSMELTTDIEINQSIPGTVPSEDSLGLDLSGEIFVSTIKKSGNHGFALDIGFQYQFNDKFKLGMSITDLGFINWNEGVRNFTSNNEGSPFIFRGIDVGALITDTVDSDEQLDNLADSLEDNLNFRVTYNPYKSYLIPKSFFTATYSLAPRTHLGALVRCDYIKGDILPSMTLNFTQEAGRFFAVTAGYSLGTNLYSKIGLGIMLKAGALQFYALTDNIQGIIQLKSSRYTNTHFGINFVFGKHRERKPKEEEPKPAPLPMPVPAVVK